jgi:anaerobic magnesium-protoporphyrin IX monomethyl ester cyclase
MPPWRLLLWVKTIEAAVQLRPKAIWRTFFRRDVRLKHSMRWYTEMGRRVWLYELKNFFLRDRRLRNGPTLRDFWGDPQDAEEQSMVVLSRRGALRTVERPARVVPA